VVGSGDGLLNPEPLVLADHRTDEQRITPNVPTERTRAWAAKLPSYQDTLSDRTSTTGLGPCWQASCCLSCTPPERQRIKA
jgi:hypothetical protein